MVFFGKEDFHFVGEIRYLCSLLLILDAADLTNDASKLAASLLDFGRQARGLAPAIAVQGLPSDDYFAVAEVAGMTHAAVRGAALTVTKAA